MVLLMVITVPDTRSARAAISLITDTSEPWLAAHVWRTWYFGVALIERRGLVVVDSELAFVAAMLHDLGLAERYDSPQPFEKSGAVGATKLAREQGWSPERVATLATAISRHLDLDAAEAEPEIALVHLGAAADVIGLHLDEIPNDLIDRVLAEHPRHDFARQLQQTLNREVEAKPSSKIARLYQDYNFGNLIGITLLDRP